MRSRSDRLTLYRTFRFSVGICSNSHWPVCQLCFRSVALVTAGAASWRDMQRELSNLTECSICADTYSDPRTLPCVHTFCLRCIEGFSEHKLPGNRVSCPLCRKEFAIPENGAEDLPKNFFIEQMKHLVVTTVGRCEEDEGWMRLLVLRVNISWDTAGNIKIDLLSCTVMTVIQQYARDVWLNRISSISTLT
jgi:hypothetical protein